ncbi:MAG TPA: septal ring lytic transglycosylase RlpA family protein [Candidatus Binatia bacterium]|jgi:rare lipoprotein A|nr:septal ring lytic transglycosylase RlpA family protein [Candidatus Binatia bacterium]
MARKFARAYDPSPERSGSRLPAIVFLLPLFLVAACSLPPSKVKLPTAPGPAIRTSQTGIASWYGPGFHGKATASGVVYDQNDLTAAHQTLPLGTRVMVTNLESGSSTEVTINDRGPFVQGRIIDLSFAAGKALGMIGPGTVPVRVEVVDSGLHKIQAIRGSLDYTLQLGSFSQLENAQKLRDRLASAYNDISIAPLQVKDGTYYRVQLGTFSDRNTAEEKARQLSQAGFPVIVMEK